MEILIKKLKDYPQYVNKVVEWLYSEWGDNNYNFWYSWVKSSISRRVVPQSYIILVDGEIAGTYSLWRCDMQSRQDLFPWFGGLYVDNRFRGKYYDGKKLGVLMQEHAINLLKSKTNYKYVYLFTEKSPKYYLENGWEQLEQIPDERDKYVTLCSFNLERIRNKKI